jgi:hypothetical protein
VLLLRAVRMSSFVELVYDVQRCNPKLNLLRSKRARAFRDKLAC